MLNVNKLLDEAIKETDSLNDGEVFLVKDLYKGYFGTEFHEELGCYLVHYF